MESSLEIVKSYLSPNILNFFGFFNEIEYSGNYEFSTLRPFCENSLIYHNTRRYYKRPHPIHIDLDYNIQNIIRIDGGNEKNDDYQVSSKFKILKKKFIEYDQEFSLTASIEIPVKYDHNVSKITKPHTKCLTFTFWHLLIDDKFIFRVAFRENEKTKKIHCNIECETQTITKSEFIRIFDELIDHYVEQNENFDVISPWLDDLAQATSTLDVKIVDVETANKFDAVECKFSGKLNLVCLIFSFVDVFFVSGFHR